jgi:hypothetical protein
MTVLPVWAGMLAVVHLLKMLASIKLQLLRARALMQTRLRRESCKKLPVPPG